MVALMLVKTLEQAAGAGGLIVIEREPIFKQSALLVALVILSLFFLLLFYLWSKCHMAEKAEQEHALPTVLYLSPAGNRLHVDRNCRTLRHSVNVRELSICQVCSHDT